MAGTFVGSSEVGNDLRGCLYISSKGVLVRPECVLELCANSINGSCFAHSLGF